MAPRLSIIVPCYNVKAYVRECMHSLLDQSFRDVEVIAVDDASPDQTGEILDEFDAADDRVTVLHLPENVGLGHARNAGLEVATGEYVLYVDSDDYLADGALAVIAERLDETSPDIMFFDFMRTEGWDHGLQRKTGRDPQPEGVFALRERPNVINRMSSAWNKAYRREFQLEHGLLFPKGVYEDWPVHYPVMFAAERISLLDRVCYYYRQRGGAITSSKNRKHFDAFDQIDRVFDFMDKHAPAYDDYRADMFRRMVWHYLIILNRPDRVPDDAREEFFLRMADHYDRYKPDGFQTPGGIIGAKHRLIQRRAFTAFEAMGKASDAADVAREARKGARRRAKAARKKVARKVRAGQYKTWLRTPMDENLAVFASYWYRAPAGNPLAIHRAMQHLAPHIKTVWVVESEDLMTVDGIDYVLEGTPEYYKALAKAKYFVNNVNFPNFVEKRTGSVHLQTQHGTPLKTMGMDLQRFPTSAKNMNFANLGERSDRWDFNISSNPHSSEVWERVFPTRFTQLEIGYPRNDRYYTATAEEVLALRRRLGIPEGTTAILYAPTHREYRADFQPQLDLVNIASNLPPDHMLLVRAHYFYDDLPELRALADDGLVRDVSKHPNTEDVCLAADVLLTDYSSIMFDYANLDRPIIIYADDYEIYKQVRGVYFDLMADAPGAVATDEDGLIAVLRAGTYDTDATRAALATFRRRFCPWDDGHAAERAVRAFFLGEEPTPAPIPVDDRTPAPAPRALEAGAGTTDAS